jgi:putative membrane-bound dehydrogenase-like protein
MPHSLSSRFEYTKEQTRALQFAFILLCIAASLFSCGEKTFESKSTTLGAEGLRVPEGFVIEPAVPGTMVTYPMFAKFDGNGRLFVIESSGKTTSTEDVLKNPTFKVLLLEDLDEDGIFDSRKVFTDRIPYPMGAAFYGGSLYVTAPPDLLRFTDTDGDGQSDEREVILTGWKLSHNAATLSGPFMGPDGWMYMCDARRGFNIKTLEGEQLTGKSARIWRCRPDGTGLESISGGGFDNTIELIFMPSGETIGTMTYFTDPKDGFRDALMHWVEGGVYPKPLPVIEQDRSKLTGELMPVMTKLSRVSHAGLVRYRGTSFGREFEGSLFSAQFNTGRIMRHVVTPVGATFRTQDEPFMVSDGLDIHPTDVVEDADGSLLVVNTGGWFIAGCPLSVVAKTDVHGGIFRIRKIDASPIQDPWGRRLDFNSMPVDSVVSFINDRRPAVRDKAIEEIVIRGEEAVPPLKRALVSSKNENVRTAVVFALYRISAPLAIEAMLTGLNDTSAQVRAAAARVAGLARNPAAVDKLVELLTEDKPPVKRQAATALGQIGDRRATEPLITALENPDDRFVEHAAIYSLITLKEIQPVINALSHRSENVRRSALIALDQMDGSPLRKNHLTPFLQSDNPALQNTAVWVLSHHREWSDMMITFLQSYIRKQELTEKEASLVTGLMITFCEDPLIQKFISSRLGDAHTSVERKLLFLDVIGQSTFKEFPNEWTRVLGNLLKEKNALISAEVFDLIRSRGISQLNRHLEAIADDANSPPLFRLKALSALAASDPTLSGRRFYLLLDFLQPAIESPVRQAAVRLIGEARLTDSQLLRLTQEIPSADIFLLPGLVKAFEDNDKEVVGKALIVSLKASPDRLENLSLAGFEKVLSGFPGSVRESAVPIIVKLQERQGKRLSELQSLEAKLIKGDVGEGRKLFFGKALCSSCHAIIGQGSDFGPDLTNIGEIRSQHDILEAILFPSASFAREYETSEVVTNGNSYTGIVKQQLADAIIVETAPETSVRLSRSDITAINPHDVSLMPAGLDKQLTIRELSDLMAYLSSLPDGLGHLKKQKVTRN